jgi:tetratricopeptide (TPR) repeat protein
LIELKEPDRALRILNEASEFLKSALPASVQYEIRYLKGRALELQGRTDQACACYEAAIESLEFLLAHISVDRAMVRFLEHKEDVYERLAGLTPRCTTDFGTCGPCQGPRPQPFRELERQYDEASERARQLRESLRSDYLRFLPDWESAAPASIREDPANRTPVDAGAS